MGRIYKDFQELISSSGELLLVLQKNGLAGIVKAVWFARQAEIDEAKYESDLLAEASKDLDRVNLELMDEIEHLSKEKGSLASFCKDLENSLEKSNRANIELSNRCSDIEKSKQQLAKEIEKMRDDLCVARNDLAAAMKEVEKAKKERSLFEAQAVEAKRHSHEYREYVKDLKEYAVNLKKYPWEKRVTSSFNKERSISFPKRVTSLFADL